MGWNGSSVADNAASIKPEKAGKKIAVGDSSATFKGVVALIVVALGVGVFYVLNNFESSKVEEIVTEDNRAISEVAPEIAQATSKAQVQKEETPEEEEYIEVNGKKIKLAADPKTGKPKYDKNVRIIPMRASDIKPKRFEFDAEEDIASLLEIEPGTPMYGEIPFGKRFKDSLVNSFMIPVEIKSTDDEYTKELKRQVQEVKDEFKELVLNGGDPADEMRKARQQLIELGQYRTSLLQELNQLRKSGEYTSQDMLDLQEAANKLLESKGVKSIEIPKVLIRNMELKERRNQ